MELRLKGYGTIEIVKATKVDGDDILIKAKDNFRKIEENTDYEITEVYLVEVDFKWSLVAWLNVPSDEWQIDRSVVIQIENQEDIQNLLKEICKEI